MYILLKCKLTKFNHYTFFFFFSSLLGGVGGVCWEVDFSLLAENSNKNNVNDSGRKPKGQSNKKNGKSGSIKASDNEASMRKEQNNLGMYVLLKCKLTKFNH
jgi:hypothetical protein